MPERAAQNQSSVPPCCGGCCRPMEKDENGEWICPSIYWTPWDDDALDEAEAEARNP